MDLNDIRKSLEDKKRWDVSCFTVDLYEEPGVDSSSKLPSQFDLTSWLPQDVNPFFHVGGGKKVSNFYYLSFNTINIFRSQISHQYFNDSIYFILLSIHTTGCRMIKGSGLPRA